MLRWIGSTSTWVDYTTAPPTIHCRTRDQLPGVSLALVGPMEKIKIERLDALIPPAIHFKYRITTKVDGSTFVQILDDIACPAGATTDAGFTDPALLPFGLDFGVPVLTFDFEGGSSTQAKAHVETEAFAPQDLAWWQSHCPELAELDSAAFIPDSVACDALSDPSLTQVLTKGQIAPWMSNALAQSVTVKAQFSGALKMADGRSAGNWLHQPKQVKVTLTNLAGGDYASAPQVTQFGRAHSLWPGPENLCHRVDSPIPRQLHLGRAGNQRGHRRGQNSQPPGRPRRMGGHEGPGPGRQL